VKVVLLMTEKRARVNGIDMAWTEKGSGETLLLIHGFPLNRTMWEPQVAFFAENYRVIAPDLRGFGATESTAEKINTMELLAEDLAALLDYCGVEQAAVAGLSMGGYVSFALCRQYPQRLKALILADTKSEGDSMEAKGGRYALLAQVRVKGSHAATDGMLPKLFAPANYEAMPETVALVQTMIDTTNPETIIATLPGLAERPDSTPTLAQIQVPTLVIHGEADALMPVAKAEEMAAQIPNGRFVAVPHAGHMANLENVSFFNETMAKFLRG
jgi:pimeloyl-ACP methyl ester carboxylesterase